MTVNQRELSSLLQLFFCPNPRSYEQKRAFAKLFVMSWAIASGVDLSDDSSDCSNEFYWCKSDHEIG